MSDLTVLATEITKLRAELMTASAAANFSQSLACTILIGLIKKGVLSQKDALSVVEAARGSIAGSGQEIIDSHSSVRQALDLCLELKKEIELIPPRASTPGA